MLNDCNNSNKTFWHIMGIFMGKTSGTSTMPPLCDTNGYYAFSDDEKVNLLNNHFCPISTILKYILSDKGLLHH